MSEPKPPDAEPVRRGANAFFIASSFAQISALLRYVILARMLGPEQLGLAATLVVMAAFFDLVSDTGSDRFLIQDRDGDTPEVQKLVHLVLHLQGRRHRRGAGGIRLADRPGLRNATAGDGPGAAGGCLG